MTEVSEDSWMVVMVAGIAAGRQAWFWGSSWEATSEPQTWDLEKKAWRHWLLKPQGHSQWHTSSQKATPPKFSGNISTNREPNIQMQEPVGATLAQATKVFLQQWAEGNSSQI